jgi:GNAT superfamily N-acetyltransferase
MTRLAPAPRAQALALIESVHGGALEAEYPLAIGPGSPVRVLGESVDGAVRAACVAAPRLFVCGEARLPIGLIGSVTTEPAWRGRGLAARVLERACDELAASGCALALLWAERPDYYAARGWSPMGAQLDFSLPCALAERLPRAPSGSVRAARPEDSSALHSLQCAHATRVERSSRESERLHASCGMRTLVLERAGAPAAWIAIGKGRDFAHTVHEWAGPTTEVLMLLRHELEQRRARRVPEPLGWIAPTNALQLARELAQRGCAGQLGCAGQRGILGHGRVIAPRRALELVAALAGAPVRAPWQPGGELVLAGPRGEVRLEPSELLELLAAPRGERACAARIEAALDIALPRLPLEPFAFGLDSL